MDKYEFEILNRCKNDYNHYHEVAADIAENLDEFECNLRDIVSDLLATYVWKHMHTAGANESFCNVMEKVVKRRIPNFEVYTVDYDVDTDESTNKTLVKI